MVGQRRGGKSICSRGRSSQTTSRGLGWETGRKRVLVWGRLQWVPRTVKMWPPASNPQDEPSAFSLVAGLLSPSSQHSCMHPALPVKTSITQLGFPYRPSLKSQRAARLEGKKLHAAHRPSEAANALCRVQRQTTRITSGSRSYTWQQKSFTFSPQDFIFCAKPISDVTSSL